MKNFKDLTTVEAHNIQNDKINSLLTISIEELDPFIKRESLNTFFVEVPPINLHSKADFQRVLAGISGNTLQGKLQWMYLKTYLNDGIPLFRKADDFQCEILFNFSAGKKLGVEFSPEKKEWELDGSNKLRAVWLLQIFSPEDNLLLLPSISIKVTVDGVEYGQQSVSTLVSTLQPNAQVGVINKLFGGFDKLKVEVIYNNPKITNPLHLIYM